MVCSALSTRPPNGSPGGASWGPPPRGGPPGPYRLPSTPKAGPDLRRAGGRARFGRRRCGSESVGRRVGPEDLAVATVEFAGRPQGGAVDFAARPGIHAARADGNLARPVDSAVRPIGQAPEAVDPRTE